MDLYMNGTSDDIINYNGDPFFSHTVVKTM